MSSAGFALNSGRNTVQLQEVILGLCNNEFFTRLTQLMYSPDIIHYRKKRKCVLTMAGLAQSVGPWPSEGGRGGGGGAGCGFDPNCALMTAVLAQSVEQWSAEQDGIGSIPRVTQTLKVLR